jgi:subtilisin family serine protease
MVRIPTRTLARRIAQPFRARHLPFAWRSLALGACAALLAGACDTPLESDLGSVGGAAGASAPATVSTLAATPSADAGAPTAVGLAAAAASGGFSATVGASLPVTAKIDARLLAAARTGAPGNVILLLDETALPALVDDPSNDGAGSPSSAGGAPLSEGRLRALAGRFNLAKDRLLGRMAAQHLAAVNRFDNLPAMHLRVDSEEALMALAADPAVARLVHNEELALADTTPADLTLINQPKAAAAGKLGAGATVAVLDTGADYTRAPFNCTAAGAPGCPIVYAADIAAQDNSLDDNGHGTNVSGIVHSVAPSAQIVALDVFTGSGAYTTDIMTAIDWCITNKAKYNIVSINMSLGGGISTTTCPTDALAVSITKARAAGILSAVASGNSGNLNAISSPACSPDAVSVGAVHAANLGNLQWSTCGDATTMPDQVACFSCSSSFLTMLAPGVQITAAGITMSGTSQATPHVAGAIAVLRAAFPTETPTATVTRLTTYGAQVKDARNGIVKPRLDLFASLNGAAAAPAPTPTPTPTPTPAPTPGPVGTIVLNAKAAFTKTAAVTATLATTSGTATQVCLTEGTSCTTFVPSATTLPFTLSSGDGTKTVRATWKDAAGNLSASAATATIALDTTAPTGGALVATATGATGLQAAFTWSGFADAGSGMGGYRLVTGTTAAIAAGCQTGTVAYEGTALTFTQTLTAAGTLYARVCGKDAVGNMSAGAPLSVVLAAPPPPSTTRSAALVGSDSTTQVGNTIGGTAFNDACPAGQVLTGFAGSLSTTTTAAVNRQIAAHCGLVQVTGATVAIKVGATLPVRGAAGTSAWTRDCPANQAVVGFSGHSGLLVDQIVLSCAPLSGAAGAATGSALTIGATTTALAAVGGSGGTAFTPVKCPAGEVATTSRVRTGDNLDAFGIACAKPTLAAN